ncbi:MAG: hypothetical protein MJB14_06660, partial [Spirochaetes bacterium]|nr:hypothetical protein [Spirochaetota bacterium]
RAVTDSSGIASCIINKAMDSAEIQSFIIQPDINSFLEENLGEDDEVADMYIERIIALGFPSKEIMVEVIPPLFGFRFISESDLGKDPKFKGKLEVLSANFKNAFIDKSGAKFTNRKTKYQLQMKVDGYLSQSEASGAYFTRLTVLIKIIDINTAKEVFSIASKEIKGGSSTEIKSLQAAINKYNKDYNEDFIMKIIAFLEEK